MKVNANTEIAPSRVDKPAPIESSQTKALDRVRIDAQQSRVSESTKSQKVPARSNLGDSIAREISSRLTSKEAESSSKNEQDSSEVSQEQVSRDGVAPEQVKNPIE